MAILRSRAVILLALAPALLLAGCQEAALSEASAPAGKHHEAATGTARPANPTPLGDDSKSAPTSTAGRTLDKTFDDIKFDIEKGEPFARSMLNDQVKQLFGERIRIRGFILPTFRKRGIDKFVLVRDNQECCFGPGAALYDCIRVTLQEGDAIEYTRSPIAVEGTFQLDEYLDPERRVGAIYHLEGAAVR
jgi:hypothetical protein